MLVSVIIPAYNRAAALPRAINSVLAQTYRDLEIIVVDDCSKDNTSEVIKGFADERIVYLRHAVNKGGAAARNTGIDRSRGEVIAFLDSDDEWTPEKLKRQMELLEKSGPQCGVVYTALQAVYEDTGKTQFLPADLKGSFLNELLIGNYVRTFSSVIVRRSFLVSVGGLDPTLKSCQDWDLYIRLMKQCAFECINEPLTIYYVNKQDPSRISNARRSIIQGHETIAKKYAEDYAKLSPTEQIRYCESQAEMYILGGSIGHSFPLMIRAFALSGNVRYLYKALRYVGRYIKGRFRKNYGY